MVVVAAPEEASLEEVVMAAVPGVGTEGGDTAVVADLVLG